MAQVRVKSTAELSRPWDFSSRYWESTRETLEALYAQRDRQTGEPIEDLNDIIYRVAYGNAIAELKYALTAHEITEITLEEALAHPSVEKWALIFARHIGEQFFWANTPGNINADPALSLKVLKYWAFGVLNGRSEDEIWLNSERLRQQFEAGDIEEVSHYERSMMQLSAELKGKGCLAACGVAYVDDTLEAIQEAAKMEALAAKAAMGMGLNTSSLRPWSSIIGNGAAASGPDRFYEKTIAKSVEAVAQGGRRGGALIELRNSNHPDILFFIEKKRLFPPPSLAVTAHQLLAKMQPRQSETNDHFKRRVLAEAERIYGEQYYAYLCRQNYLKNTNITVLAMPGFMDAVREKKFYATRFGGKDWDGPVFDPRRPVQDPKTGQQAINRLTREPLFEEYTVDLTVFPDALPAAQEFTGTTYDVAPERIKVLGALYAPEVFARIVEGMRTAGEPGLAFYDSVNAANANSHVYQLDTCNPCGEQFLPAGRGRDGRLYMGTCNLASMHAAHASFWGPDGSFDYQSMKDVAQVMQRFMDNVTDVSWYPIPAQNLTSRLERRNGGGFAGIAEHLSRLSVEFGSEASQAAVEKLFREFSAASLQASLSLAEERGVYALWEGSRFQCKGLKVRNTCMTNNAPTGTLAQALQTSWGVDPHNGIVFSRKVRGRPVEFVAPGFAEAMKKHDAWPASEEGVKDLMQTIRDNHKSCRGLPSVPPAVQTAFPVRIEVEPEAYIRHLAAIHRGSSDLPEAFNSVSNTCSIQPDISADAVSLAVMLACELNVKDVTFYPDGSRLSQPVEQIAAQVEEQEVDLFSFLSEPGVVADKNAAARRKLLPPNRMDGFGTCVACENDDWARLDGCWVCQYCGHSVCG
jgi:ribonucleotide reductase alpha subunit